KETEELAIIVDVIQKKALEELTEEDIRIPSYIEIVVSTFEEGSLTYREEKIPIDVVEVGEIIDEDELSLDVERTSPEIIGDDPSQKVRPCPGGLFIQTEGLHVRGTLGVNTVYKGGFRLISNNHVISKNGSVGQTIHQPTPPRPGRELVKVTGFISIQYYFDFGKLGFSAIKPVFLFFCMGLTGRESCLMFLPKELDKFLFRIRLPG
ncbi:hypothetical protein HYR99_32030, partial [Candidatus Poribacteria bacterium]|nr:hypothetical protein [Candidatus Poribacteria bacterium]